MARLPTVDGDDGTWGQVLNDFLLVSHDINGTLRPASITSSGGETTASKGQANGYATLDGTGKVPAGQLPSTSNSVTSVNTQTGAVTLTAANVGADAAGAATTAQTNAATYTDNKVATSGAQLTSAKGQANGYAGLDGTGKVPSGQLPAPSNLVTSVNTQTGAVSLTAANVGADSAGAATTALGSANTYTDNKVATSGAEVTSAKGQVNGYAGLDGTGKVPSAQLPAPSNLVTSVNTQTGAVSLTAANVGADAAGAATTAQTTANTYTDTKIAVTPAYIIYAGSYANRSTATASSTRMVIWVGPSAPANGGVGAVDGLDVWWRTP